MGVGEGGVEGVVAGLLDVDSKGAVLPSAGPYFG